MYYIRPPWHPIARSSRHTFTFNDAGWSCTQQGGYSAWFDTSPDRAESYPSLINLTAAAFDGFFGEESVCHKWNATLQMSSQTIKWLEKWSKITAVAEAEEVPLETKATEMSEMCTLIENADLETWKSPKRWSLVIYAEWYSYFQKKM